MSVTVVDLGSGGIVSREYTEDELAAIAEAQSSFEPPPSVVSMRQARLALLQAGLLVSVNAAVAAGSEADKITWEYATEVRRDDALVQNLSVALGLTSEQLDNLFTTAINL